MMILWGDKYDVAYVNRLVRAVRARASRPARFVLLSDRARGGLDPAVEVRAIPPFWLSPAFTGSGCQAKLAMFEAGVLAPDLPCVYVDLDSVVTGDLARAPRLLRRADGVALLQSAMLPFGAVARALCRLTAGRRYARGNSSLVVFHPARQTGIAARFRDLHAQDSSFRPLISDERFVSWAAQPVAQAIPGGFAVKLATEFTSRVAVLAWVRAALPWVRTRRAGLVMVTLAGGSVKPAALLALAEGGRVTDARGRVLIWSDAVLGRTRRDILSFYGEPVGGATASTVLPVPPGDLPACGEAEDKPRRRMTGTA